MLDTNQRRYSSRDQIDQAKFSRRCFNIKSGSQRIHPIKFCDSVLIVIDPCTLRPQPHPYLKTGFTSPDFSSFLNRTKAGMTIPTHRPRLFFAGCTSFMVPLLAPEGMFANCGRARYNGLRMCKAMGRACARQWLAHVQSNGMRMAMVHVNGAIKAIGCACARQLSAHMQSN